MAHVPVLRLPLDSQVLERCPLHICLREENRSQDQGLVHPVECKPFKTLGPGFESQHHMGAAWMQGLREGLWRLCSLETSISKVGSQAQKQGALA